MPGLQSENNSELSPESVRNQQKRNKDYGSLHGFFSPLESLYRRRARAASQWTGRVVFSSRSWPL